MPPELVTSVSLPRHRQWEGGIRANAFASGGWLPLAVRGTKQNGLIAIWDWYATFCRLAGVDPTDVRAKRAGLPPIDSLDMSALLLGSNVTSPRRVLAISTEPRPSNLTTAPLCSSYDRRTPMYEDPRIQGDELAPIPASGRCTTVNGVIVDDGEGQPLWKLLTGDLQQAIYLGPHWPNRTGPSVDSFNPRFTERCGDGCLYDLRSDPLETSDLAHKLPDKVKELHAMIEAFEATAFNPRRGGIDARSCEVAATRYGGFWGPFLP